MRDDLEVTSVRTRGGTVLLRVSGRLDAQSASVLLGQCNAVRAAGDNLVLNLNGVTFIASSGIGALLALVEQFAEAKRGVRFAAPSPPVDSVIRLLNLEQFLTIYSTEADALADLEAA